MKARTTLPQRAALAWREAAVAVALVAAVAAAWPHSAVAAAVAAALACFYAELAVDVVRTGVTGPLPVPVLGNLEYFSWYGRLHQNVLKQMRDFGPTYRTMLLVRRVYTITHPADLRIVLGTEMDAFDRSDQEMELLPEFLGGGLILMPNGDGWRRARAAFHGAFARAQLELLVPYIDRQADAMCRALDRAGGRAVRVHSLALRLTFDSICYASFGRDFGCMPPDGAVSDSDPMPPALEAFDFILSHSLKRFMFPAAGCVRVFLAAGERRYHASIELLRDAVRQQLREVRAGGGTGGLMESAMRLQDADGGDAPLTDDELVQHVLTLIFAGHDTTATTVSHALYFLAAHPAELERVRAEVREVGRGGLDRAVRLAAVVKETLRLRPAAPARGRSLRRAVSLATCDLPEGAQVAFSAYGTHHDPSVWRDPYAFNASRFDPRDGDSAARPRDPFAYVPFGGGKRRCIGEQLALMEVRAVVAALVLRFTPRLVDGFAYDDLALLTMYPRGNMPLVMEPVGEARGG